MKTVPLSFLLDNMNVHQDFDNLEPQYKVRAIDASIREIRQGTNFPWNLKKETLKVFADVLEYPIDDEHDELAYIDKQDKDNYAEAARFFNTSLQQFYEDVNRTRNLMSDIWKDGTRFIGINYKDLDIGMAQLSSAEVTSQYTASDDASGVVLDTINNKEGNSCIQFTVTDSAGVATMLNTTAFTSDANYLKKFHFRWIYLDSVPTSIEMRLQTDDSNYLSSGALTTQFAGNSFVADDWNLIAYDLNEATETGTFDENDIASEKTILTGAATGVYRLDQSSLRGWKLMDYWFYSLYNVVTSTSSVADKEFFIGTSESESDIDTTDKLLGEPKWIDYILATAKRKLLGDIENPTLLSLVREEKKEAKKNFNGKFPTMTRKIITKRRVYNNDPNNAYLVYRD